MLLGTLCGEKSFLEKQCMFIFRALLRYEGQGNTVVCRGFAPSE